MIKDLSIIRKELENYVEVQLPYEFPKNCCIKYITLKDEEESFYKGGQFLSEGNDSLLITNKIRTWSVPTCLRNKDGTINYVSRFFIPEKEEEEVNKETKKLQETIEFQQSIIEKLTNQLKESELQKKYIQDDKTEYEELLQQNRYHLKDLSIQLRETNAKVVHYENIIQKLSQSHPLMNYN